METMTDVACVGFFPRFCCASALSAQSIAIKIKISIEIIINVACLLNFKYSDKQPIEI